jgi:hypothetical protein
MNERGCRSVGDDSEEINMPRTAVVFAVAVGVCGALATSPSKTTAAPKRHHETLYYTITLTNAARGPRLKAKPQQTKKAVMPQGSVRFRVDGGQSSRLNNARLRER